MLPLIKPSILAVAICLISANINAQCNLLHGPVVINEFLASNGNIASNALDEFEDFVELYNTGAQPFNLEGWFLSDSRGSTGRTKFQFPNVSIPGNGYLIIWCDGVGDPFLPGLNAAFNLSGTEGELVVLSNPDTVIVDYVRFGPVDENVAVGRFPNGSGSFTKMVPSYSGPNFNGESFNVVINEYMATNSETASDEFGESNDWIEIYNNSNNAVNLSAYMLSDDHNEPAKFTFPSGTSIGANQYLIVWADNEPFQGTFHADFALSATGEELILSRPDTSTVDFFAFGEQATDVSEGRFPNGLGKLIPCMAPSINSLNLGTVSVSELQVTHQAMRVYPNPATALISVENPLKKKSLVRIVDIYGRVVHEEMLAPNVNQLDINYLVPGLYIISGEWGSSRLLKLN
jgi:hypothetical protein